MKIIEIFAQPYYLLLLAIVPALAIWYYFRHKTIKGELLYSGFDGYAHTRTSYKYIFWHFQHILRLLTVTSLILALARPQSSTSTRKVDVEGIDIMLSIDVSGSMLAEDMKPNRIEATKDVAKNFIAKRPNDRIGLVAFSGIAFTQCPLTIDHNILNGLLSKIRNNMVIDGTAIGDGLGLSVERLIHSDAISKVVILLTDGINNMGFIDPVTATQIAKSYNIRVYTIGAGTYGKAPYPFQTPFGIRYENVDVKIDEPLLKIIAQMTGGKYFRATDKESLQNIYDEIDILEKTKIEVTHYTHTTDLFIIPLLVGLTLLFFEMLIRYCVVRALP